MEPLADAAVGVVVVDQRILLHPVEILETPLAGIFLVARRPVALAHRHPPLHAVQLPAQLVVLHGPVLPVDILPIKIRGLIARMHEEAVLQTVVGPAALGLGRLCRGGVEVGRLDTGAAAVVGQQGILGLHRVAAAQRLGHRLQTGTVEIQTFEEAWSLTGSSCALVRQAGSEASSAVPQIRIDRVSFFIFGSFSGFSQCYKGNEKRRRMFYTMDNVSPIFTTPIPNLFNRSSNLSNLRPNRQDSTGG